MNDATELVVAGTGKVQLAPYGTTLPVDTDVRAALDAAFVDLGFTTEDGVTWSDGRTVEDVRAWQARYAIRKLVTEYNGSLAFTPLQWNKDNLELLYDGVMTEPTADTVHKLTPTRTGVLAEYSAVIDWDDGSEQFRLIVAKLSLEGDIEVQLTNSAATGLPTEWSILDDGINDPWALLGTPQAWSVD
jgi:hypothetical protein